ncbi:peptidoglycan-binding domain-containing protein [Fulvimarina endophytica]|nr:peptidoglycan-binding protein [Fulvimarina endophytica]
MQRSAGRLDGLGRLAGSLAVGGSRLAAGAAAQMRRHPVASAGSAVFGAFFVWVAANALYAQTGHHPAPLVATRGMPAPSLDAAAEPDPMVRELQMALATAGLYTRTIDGRFGSGTKDAIEAFQRQNGLAVTGTPTPDLLDAVRKVAVASLPSPSRKPADWTDAEERELPETNDAGRGGRVVETADSLSSIIAGDEAETLRRDELVKKIQTGLTAISVADLSADGIAGARTRAAIEKFEMLEGMDVTGEPRPELLEQLIRIGALPG